MKQRTRLMHNEDDLVSYNMMNSKKDDGDENEIQLHKMKPHEHYIEAQVQEGDTLQAIALRFYCSISELKRINHIHKDNEIFARRTVKVPITPYSVLTELVPIDAPSTSNQIPFRQQLENNHNVNQPDNTNITKTEDDDCSIDCNTVVLNSTLAPAVVPYMDIEPAQQVTEDTQLLPNKEKASVEAVVVKQLTSQGADLGLKWYHLLGVVLILGFAAPLIYVLFYLDKHEIEHPDVPPLHNTS